MGARRSFAETKELAHAIAAKEEAGEALTEEELAFRDSLNDAARAAAAQLAPAMKPFKAILEELNRALAPFRDPDKPSDDFREPAARKRFAEWFESSELTLGKRGHHTYTALAELLGVSLPTASRYVKGEVPLSRWAAAILRENIGEVAYYEMVHGAGAWDAQAMDARREELLAELAGLAHGMEISKLETLLALAKAL